MSNRKYDWKRFWYQRGVRIDFSDEWYLCDDDSDTGRYLCHPNIEPFESLANTKCLILLGEPGAGKTTSLQLEYKEIQEHIGKDDQSFWVDLKDYHDVWYLDKKVFNGKEFSAWKNGSNNLHLFFDSLDECQIQIDNIGRVLLNEFGSGSYPIERLYLRIICRTGYWDSSLEDKLRELFISAPGDDTTVKVYQLAPLRRTEIIEAAKSESIAPDPFLQEVKKMGAVPLAMMPVTLNFLLHEWKNNTQLSSTRAELYEKGCKYLCTEIDEPRTEQDHRTPTAEQRMAVAARIAAITVFCNKSAIWTGVDIGDAPDDQELRLVTLKDLSGGKEEIDGDELQVDRRVVKETLKTALFSDHGQNRTVWNHRTYAEFLAAYYIQHNLKLEQIKSLILLDDTDKKVVPQLYETAAWLAEMNANIFRTMLQIDPEILLHTDLENVGEQDRIAIVDALLGLYDDKKLRVFDIDRRTRYKKLNHPKLAQQLKPYIRDKTKRDAVRQFAIDVAEACQLQSLQNDLADIALDASQTSYTRINAGYAVVRVGDSKTKERLRPLAIGEAGEDPNDELKGIGLKALWPDHMGAEELFGMLTPPKNTALMGAYYSFLSYDLPQRLKPSDLPAGLKWIRQQQPGGLMPWHDALEDVIILRALEQLDDPDVLQELVETLLSRLENYEGIVGQKSHILFNEILKSDDKRHKILCKLISSLTPLVVDLDAKIRMLIHTKTPLVLTVDVPWLLKYYHHETTSKEVKTTLAQLMFWAFDKSDPDQFALLLTASQKDSILAEIFKPFFGSIENNSPEGRQKHKDQEMQEPEQVEGRVILTSPPEEYISKYLDESESGNSSAWVFLAYEMTRRLDSTPLERDMLLSNPDVTALYGWNASDETTKERIVKAAEKYMLDQTPNRNECLNNIWTHNSFAGLKAISLVCHKNRESPLLKDVDIWKKWAPAIIFYPILNNQNKELHRKIACQAYRCAPKEIIESLEALINTANRKDQTPIVIDKLPTIIGKLEECWDESLSKAMLLQVKSPKLNPKTMGHILDVLLHHQVNEVKELLEALIPSPLPHGSRRSKAVEAAAVLFTHSENVCWSFAWSAMKRNQKFGRDVMESLADPNRIDRPSTIRLINLDEEQLADLYV